MRYDKFYCMSIGGDCSCLGYLGEDRIRGPVDNVLTVTDECVKSLFEGTYLTKINDEYPVVEEKEKGYEGDSDRTYAYSHVKIVHHNPFDIKYRAELQKRLNNFKKFLKRVKTEDNCFFTFNLNTLDLDENRKIKSSHFINTLNYLKEINILDKVIVVGTRQSKPIEDIWQNAYLSNIQDYIDEFHFKYIEIVDNHWWTDNESSIQFTNKLNDLLDEHTVDVVDTTENMLNTHNNKVIGIISWLPEVEKDRVQRIDRLNRLMIQLDDIFPEIPVMFIAQNWKDFTVKKDNRNIIIYRYDKLGIKGARSELRNRFLDSEFDYLIMFDDDAIIECCEKDGGKKYLDMIDSHKNGFCFLQYHASQLSGCAISKYIYQNAPMVDVSAENNEGYEDTIWSHLLKYKFSNKEFSCNTIKCIHFQNQKENAPSTWSDDGERNWKQLTENTYKIVDYIKEHKELPNLRVFFEFGKLVNINYTYEQYMLTKEKELVELLVSRYPDSIKPIMRDALEKAHKLK